MTEQRTMGARTEFWLRAGSAIAVFLCTVLVGSTSFAQPEACNPVCPAGQECRQNDCVVSTPFVETNPTTAAACFPTCRSGYVCQVDQCVPLPCVPDCRTGYVCQVGVCEPTPQVSPAPHVTTSLSPPVGSPAAQPSAEPQAPEQDPGVLPARFTERPLTLPKGTMHGGFGFGSHLFFGSRETTTSTSFAGSVGLGIVDAFQLTIVPLRLLLDPDQQAFDPLLGLFGSFVRTRAFQMGASFRMSLPVVDDGAGFTGQLALNFLVRGRVFRFLGRLFSTFYLDESSTGEGGTTDLTTAGGLVTEFGFQAGSIFAVNIGLTHILTDGDPESYRLSPDLTFVFTVPRGLERSPLMDIDLAFSIPGLVGAGRTDTVDVRGLSITLDAVFYGDLY